MANRPGVAVSTRFSPPARGNAVESGQWMVAGLALKGPTDRAVKLLSMTDFLNVFGARQSWNAITYDALDTFFREGGGVVYFVRIVGPAATFDTVTLNDAGAAASLSVKGIGPGPTDLDVAVVAGTVSGFVLVIRDLGVEVERSYDLADVSAAVTWSTSSNYVRVTATGANNPAIVAAQALISGADDRASITDTHRTTALTLFPVSLGAGQVSIVGATTTAAHVGVVNHCVTTSRTALLDGADTASDTTLKAQASGDLAAGTLTVGGGERGGIFAPWLVVPGIVSGTTRTVAPTALAAAVMARNDALTGNPNDPAAGTKGEGRYVIGLTQPEWTPAQREALNAAGVNVFRVVQGAVRLYGYRTIASGVVGDPWSSLGSARLRMVIEHAYYDLGEHFMFNQIDGKGHKLAEFKGAIIGELQGWYNLGALYGATPDDAFSVDVGAAINTPTTLANNDLRAAIGIRTSPFAELIYFDIVKIPITESL